MAGTPGRKALVKVSGAAVSFTDEACSTVTANTVYQITNAAKRVWDRTAAITVKKDAVTQSAALYTLNRLTGKITFLADIGGGHTITVSGSYLPMSTAAEGKAYNYDLMRAILDDTEFGDSDVTKVPGLKDASGSIGRWWSVNTYFRDALLSENAVVLEFYTDASAAFDMRMWALIDKAGIAAAAAGLIDESVNFVGATDADGRVTSS